MGQCKLDLDDGLSDEEAARLLGIDVETMRETALAADELYYGPDDDDVEALERQVKPFDEGEG